MKHFKALAEALAELYHHATSSNQWSTSSASGELRSRFSNPDCPVSGLSKHEMLELRTQCVATLKAGTLPKEHDTLALEAWLTAQGLNVAEPYDKVGRLIIEAREIYAERGETEDRSRSRSRDGQRVAGSKPSSKDRGPARSQDSLSGSWYTGSGSRPDPKRSVSANSSASLNAFRRGSGSVALPVAPNSLRTAPSSSSPDRSASNRAPSPPHRVGPPAAALFLKGSFANPRVDPSGRP